MSGGLENVHHLARTEREDSGRPQAAPDRLAVGRLRVLPRIRRTAAADDAHRIHAVRAETERPLVGPDGRRPARRAGVAALVTADDDCNVQLVVAEIQVGVGIERREVDELALACQQAGFAAGLKEAQELTAAYLRYLAHHPATARTVARKMAIRFVSDTPSDALIDQLAQVFLDSGTDIKTTLRALVASVEFLSSVEAA